MEITFTFEDCKIIAEQIMENIAYDNGTVDRWHPMTYPSKWLNNIAKKSFIFFNENPQLMNDEDIEEICNGEETEVQNKYSNLKGWDELNKVLNEYFDKKDE